MATPTTTSLSTQLPPPPTLPTSPTALLSAADAAISHTRALHTALTTSVTPATATPAAVLASLAEAENTLITASRLLSFWEDVSPDAGMRAAAGEARERFAAFKIEMAMDEGLFGLVEAVLQRREEGAGSEEVVSGAARRWLEKVRREHVANGLSLPAGGPRERFKEIKSRIGELEGRFRKDLNEARSVGGGMWFRREELDGVDESVLGRFAVGDGEHEGMVRASFGNSDYLAVLRTARDAETRKKMFIAVDNMMAPSVPLFKEAIVLRNEAARMLGYPSHAAFRTIDYMAQNPQTVNKFLAQLHDGLSKGVQIEIRRLKDLKKEDVQARGEVFDCQYFIWDHLFYHTMSLEKDYAIDQQSVSEYFSYGLVVSVMLEIFEKIMGLRFMEMDGGGKVWHNEVQLFGVWNAVDLGGEFLGYLYLDLYPREGKSNNPRSVNLVPGIPNQHPATALLCSFPKPDDENPSPLQHNEIVLLFHELGHCIHDLVCTTANARLHGPDGTALDFSEAPSQLLEYWFWTPAVLKTIGRHYSYLTPEYLQSWKGKAEGKDQPPETLPEETIVRLVSIKHVNAAVPTLRQLAISIFDMEVHSKSTEDLANLDVSTTYNRMRRDMSQLEDLSDLGEGHNWAHGWAIYPHLMDDYDAGFYSYLFSKVYAADIFGAKFASDPMSADEGRRFRRIVLEKGGTQDEMEMMKEYLGREPRMHAFCHELGIS